MAFPSQNRQLHPVDLELRDGSAVSRWFRSGSTSRRFLGVLVLACGVLLVALAAVEVAEAEVMDAAVVAGTARRAVEKVQQDAMTLETDIMNMEAKKMFDKGVVKVVETVAEFLKGTVIFSNSSASVKEHVLLKTTNIVDGCGAVVRNVLTTVTGEASLKSCRNPGPCFHIPYGVWFGIDATSWQSCETECEKQWGPGTPWTFNQWRHDPEFKDLQLKVTRRLQEEWWLRRDDCLCLESTTKYRNEMASKHFRESVSSRQHFEKALLAIGKSGGLTCCYSGPLG